MKKNRFICAVLYLLFLAIPCFVSGQNLKLSGIVKEKGGDAMPGVMIVIKDSENNILAYTTSDYNGSFTLTYPKEATTGLITFSCIGFRDRSMPLNRIKNRLEIIMEEDAFVLKEVTVRVPPINARGDTLTYNVASFKNASDRTIEDVIKKLPGIRVSDDGRIYYNGEAINKFYIEGLDLLSGRYALASRNISPDDVTAVNVYENHQAKRVLKDIEYSDKAAINLKLKNKSLLRPIGYIKAGAGIDDYKSPMWLGEGFGLLIHPRTQVLVSAKGNNSGFSYTNETGSLAGSDLAATTNALSVYPKFPFGSADIPTAKFYDNRSISASINTISKLNEYTTLNITADYTDELNRFSNAETICYTTADNLTLRESVSNSPHSAKSKLKLKLENNAPKKYISEQLSFIGHFNSGRYDIKTDKPIHQHNSTRDYNIRNQLNGIFRISGHAIDFKSDIQLSMTPISSLSASDGEGTFIMQNLKGLCFMTKEEIGYSWFINAKSNIGVKAAFDFSYNSFKSMEGSPISSIGNNVKGYDITTAIEPQYQYRTSNSLIFNISAPIRLNNLKFDNVLDATEFPTNRFDIDFRSSINYNTPFNLKTKLTVGRQNRLGGMSDYIVNPIYVTFRQSSRLGSGQLGQRTGYYATFDLAYRNTIEGLFSSASVLYRLTESNRLGSLDVNGDNVLSSTIEKDNRSHLVNTSLSFSKTVYDWNSTFAIDGNYERLKKSIIRQTFIHDLSVNNFTCNLNISSNPIKDYLIILFSLKYSHSMQKISAVESRNHTNRTSINLKLSTHPIKDLEFGINGYFSSSDISLNSTKNSFFIDSSAKYRIKSFDIELIARNLTNTKHYSYSYISDSDIYAYSFALRPLEILLTLKHSF